MATSKQSTTTKTNLVNDSLFHKENFVLMLIGLIVLAIGFLLMSGGKSPDPTKFDDNVIYSVRRITIAPAVIILGFIIEIFAIMKKPKKSE
jgi:DUF3098 family protein